MSNLLPCLRQLALLSEPWTWNDRAMFVACRICRVLAYLLHTCCRHICCIIIRAVRAQACQLFPNQATWFGLSLHPCPCTRATMQRGRVQRHKHECTMIRNILPEARPLDMFSPRRNPPSCLGSLRERRGGCHEEWKAQPRHGWWGGQRWQGLHTWPSLL